MIDNFTVGKVIFSLYLHNYGETYLLTLLQSILLTCLPSLADLEGEREDRTTTYDTDVKYLNELTTTCEQKGTDYMFWKQLRAEEIETIQKAIDIIFSKVVSGYGESYLVTLLHRILLTC